MPRCTPSDRLTGFFLRSSRSLIFKVTCWFYLPFFWVKVCSPSSTRHSKAWGTCFTMTTLTSSSSEEGALYGNVSSILSCKAWKLRPVNLTSVVWMNERVAASRNEKWRMNVCWSRRISGSGRSWKTREDFDWTLSSLSLRLPSRRMCPKKPEWIFYLNLK